MKVILLRDVARIGRRYEIKDVPAGHALNFLIPQKLALTATPEHQKRVDALRAHQKGSLELESVNFDEACKKLAESTITLPVEANTQGHLFKGVKADDIALCVNEAGIKITKEHIDLPHPLKAVGNHEITLRSGEKMGTFTLTIVAK